MDFAHTLQALLKSTGITVSDLAASAGVTPRAVQYYLKGEREPAIGVARRMAKTLGVTLDYLAGDDPAGVDPEEPR